MIKNPVVGQRVSYEDDITPREVGTITLVEFINRRPSYYECEVTYDNGDTTISTLRSEGWKRVKA